MDAVPASEEEPESHDRKIARSFSLPLPGGATVRLAQDFLMSETGGAVWDASLVLIDFFSRQEKKCLDGLRVLELGAGIGATAVALAALGAHVVATDRCGAALRLLRRNVGGVANVCVKELDWRDGPFPGEAFDFVVASDVLYDPDAFPVLRACLARVCAPRLVLAFRERNRAAEQEFVASLLSSEWARVREASGVELAHGSLYTHVHREGLVVHEFIRVLS